MPDAFLSEHKVTPVLTSLRHVTNRRPMISVYLQDNNTLSPIFSELRHHLYLYERTDLDLTAHKFFLSGSKIREPMRICNILVLYLAEHSDLRSRIL